MEQFIKKYGKSPEALEKYLLENEITRTQFANMKNYPRTTVLRHFKAFNVTGYVKSKKEFITYSCSLCGNIFNRYVSPSQRERKELITYCGLECYHESLRKDTDDTIFQFNTNCYEYVSPATNVGYYLDIEMSHQHRATIDRKKVNHYFFQKGIIDEPTAYVFGLWLTDGHVALFRNGKSLKELNVLINNRGQKIICSYIATLQLTDHDIIEKIASVIKFKNKIIESSGTHKGKPTKQTKKIHINSPYFYHDLVGLGCGLNKTYSASYPLIPDTLDMHFIRGILDGDGSFYITKDGRLHLKFCGNDLLMYGIYEKIKCHLNVTPTDVEYPSQTGMKSFCQIRYGTKESLKIRDWLYSEATIYGQRKHDKSFSYEPPMLFQTFTTAQLAKYLGTSIYFIQQNVFKYSLPHIMVGKVCCFKEEHLPLWEEFLKERLSISASRFGNKEELIKKWQ